MRLAISLSGTHAHIAPGVGAVASLAAAGHDVVLIHGCDGGSPPCPLGRALRSRLPGRRVARPRAAPGPASSTGRPGAAVVRRLLDEGAVVVVDMPVEDDVGAALLAEQVGANALLLLTDVSGVAVDWGTPSQRWIATSTPEQLRDSSLGPPSMVWKAEAARRFVERTGGIAAIGDQAEVPALLQGTAGTLVTPAGRRTYHRPHCAIALALR